MCFLNDCCSIIHSTSITHLLHLLNNESEWIIYWDKKGPELAERKRKPLVNQWACEKWIQDNKVVTKIVLSWAGFMQKSATLGEVGLC